MNELEAKCYLTKKGDANNSDHTCTALTLSQIVVSVYLNLLSLKHLFQDFVTNRTSQKREKYETRLVIATNIFFPFNLLRNKIFNRLLLLRQAHNAQAVS